MVALFLNSAHRRAIARNHALLAMYTNPVELCKTLVNDWSSKFDDVTDEEKNSIVAAVLARSGKTDEAVELLLAGSNQRQVGTFLTQNTTVQYSTTVVSVLASGPSSSEFDS